MPCLTLYFDVKECAHRKIKPECHDGLGSFTLVFWLSDVISKCGF